MLVTVIIFLRESLEAAFLVSILLAISHKYRIPKLWVVIALGIGFVCSSISASFLGSITNLFDGTGQELMNATLLMSIVVLVGVVCFRFSPLLYSVVKAGKGHGLGRSIKYLLIMTVAVATTHEGTELSIYSYAYSQTHESIMILIIGGIIGTGIGASVGAIIYYLLVVIPDKISYRLFLLILVLIASGMSLQAATYLAQTGWLPSPPALWNSSSFIPEASLTGQLLYALFAYEATPNVVQVGFYLATLLCYVFLIGFAQWKKRKSVLL